MGPELVRFYGGSPREWEALPWATAERYFRAIPHVRRREGVQPMNAPVKAAPIAAPAKPRQPSTAELRAKLPGFGIGVVEEKRG